MLHQHPLQKAISKSLIIKLKIFLISNQYIYHPTYFSMFEYHLLNFKEVLFQILINYLYQSFNKYQLHFQFIFLKYLNHYLFLKVYHHKYCLYILYFSSIFYYFILFFPLFFCLKIYLEFQLENHFLFCFFALLHFVISDLNFRFRSYNYLFLFHVFSNLSLYLLFFNSILFNFLFHFIFSYFTACLVLGFIYLQ